MNTFDKDRIENAIWILEQYKDELINNAIEFKLDNSEVKEAFTTLSYIKGNMEKYKKVD